MSGNTRTRKPLHLAAKFIIFFALVGIAFYVYWSRLNRTQQLVIAVEQADTTTALQLLASGADLNRRAPFSDEEDWRDMVSSITDRTRRQGPPLLLLAVTSGNDSLVRALLKHDADPNAHDAMGMTPLMAAAVAGNFSEVEALLEKGAAIDAADRNGRTALCFAARYRRDHIVQFLHTHGARIDVRVKNGDTPLTDAARNDDTELITILLQFGADVNARTKDGQTPLLFAADHNDPGSIRLLLDHGANVNASNKNGITPLLALLGPPRMGGRGGGLPTGLSAPPPPDVRLTMPLLLIHGADVNARSRTGETPLIRAAQTANIATLRALLRAGARPGPGSRDLTDLLCAAVYAPTTDNLRFLLNRFAGPRLGPDPRPLQYATGNLAAMKLLLDHGADVNARYFGSTALLNAIARGEPAEVKLLLSYGADVNAKMDNGYTAFSTAKVSNNPRNRAVILAMLKQAAARARR